MIYRVIGETERWRWADEEQTELVRVTGKMMGAMGADFGWPYWDDLKAPSLHDPRVRFWFTQAGWDRYGRLTLAHAMRSGRTWRLLRQKNPPRSRVAYSDKWQLALLPPGKGRGKHHA